MQITKERLSSEQQQFIDKALEGNNILVDACIGSGKTTAIQFLCDALQKEKKILYLTYNKLLKLDARSKIHNKNVTVTNYHGFAFMKLKKKGITVGVSDMIQTFIREIDRIEPYDVLIIDEYQDIEQELASLLDIVKNSNPDMQIVAVGDMQQKIYDKTSLDVMSFIESFLGDYIKLEFTQCFRLSEELANMLGRVWKKKIIGVNQECIVEEMDIDSIIDFLSQQKTSDILCLGQRNADLSVVLNALEEQYPDAFNKNTVYASISDRDARGATEPNSNSAIFTTYDSSKGLERNICVVFDFTEEYWGKRIDHPQVSYEILRNIFCVAASRGKKHIIFAKTKSDMLSEATLSEYKMAKTDFMSFDISEMFDFKYKEDVEECFEELKIKLVDLKDNSKIDIPNNDGMIDLSPCIGIYQEAVYFRNYDIDVAIQLKLWFMRHLEWFTSEIKEMPLDKKILYLTSLETNQDRYKKQVNTPFVSEDHRRQIVKRLKNKFSEYETVQVECGMHFTDRLLGEELFSIIGIADVVKDDIVYELKFVSELMHEHFLQCACYMVALKKKKGIVWNTRDNKMYEIHIKNTKRFMDKVIRTITKGAYSRYYEAKKVKNITFKNALG